MTCTLGINSSVFYSDQGKLYVDVYDKERVSNLGFINTEL